MRKKKLLVLALALLANCHFSIGQNIRYVNPLIGTDVQRNVTEGLADSEVKGQTIPAVGVPNGMVSWVAQTMSNEQKCYSPYYYYYFLFLFYIYQIVVYHYFPFVLLCYYSAHYCFLFLKQSIEHFLILLFDGEIQCCYY